MSQNLKPIHNINGILKLRCSICKYLLPLEEFGNDKNKSTGKTSYCKVCRKTKYDVKRYIQSNTGIVGIFMFTCPCCNNDFTTRNPSKVFCCKKCLRRDWYIRNEQTINGKLNGRSKNYLNFQKEIR